MTRTVAILALALAGCAPHGPVDPQAMAVLDNVADAPSAAPASTRHDTGMTSPEDPLRACDGDRANRLTGRPVDAALKAEAMRLVGARTIRVIPPGAMVTMDYRGDRLNIAVDSAGKALRFRCG